MEEGILLHCCCGVCAAYPLKILKEKFKKIIVYFYNPNIHPQEEYLKRKKTLKKIASLLEVEFLEEKYRPEDWFFLIKGLEREPERGKRCFLCYQMRLEKTAYQAQRLGIHFFATTLTISPYKDAFQINTLGKKITKETGVNFWQMDFERKKAFKETLFLSQKYRLYHQKYCGCLFSKINSHYYKNNPRERVKEAVKIIPKGKVLSYQTIAYLANIKSPRYVGFALKNNQDIKVPCHRVIRSDGSLANNWSLGGYLEQKRRLEKEGIKFLKEKAIESQKYFWLNNVYGKTGKIKGS